MTQAGQTGVYKHVRDDSTELANEHRAMLDEHCATVDSWPVRGVRGDYRVARRHGVSKARTGRRQTVGIIFHAA